MKKNIYLSLLALVLAVVGANAEDESGTTLAIAATGDTVEVGNAATLTVNITAGTAPFTVSWINGKHNAVATTTLEAIGEVAVEYTPTECDLYYVTVTDAAEQSATDTCRVIVTGEAVTATFENLYLDEGSYWAGPDTKGTIGSYWGADQYEGSFVSGSYSFSNNYIPSWLTWTGFGYSNSTDSDFEYYYYDQWNAATGGGYNGSENFAVAYSEGTITVLNAEADTIDGFYITNNTYLTNSVVNGDDYARAFVSGDYIRVVFTGTQADGSTSTVTYYLADYTSENEADRYYLDTWQWVDLRALGAVSTVTFAFEGTDESYGYLNTPTYFCLDNFNGERVITVADAQEIGTEVDLSTLFTFESSEATITYAITDGEATLADGILTGTTAGEVIVSATQRGKIQFVSITFTAPALTIAATGDTVEAGSAATLAVDVTSGTAPFTVSWINGKHEAVATTTLEAIGEVAVEYTPTECDLYYVTVTDAAEQSATDTCRIIVTGEAVTATFENLYLDEGSYWAGPDTKGTIGSYWGADQYEGSFVSGSYSFSNSYVPSWMSWSGFGYSNSTDSDFEYYYYDQWNAATGGGYDGSDNFAVAYSEGTITVLNAEADTIDGFYITNNTYLTNSVVNGDDYARAFVSGDYIRVVFTGTQADGSTSTVTYYLADYTSENEADWYYLDTWQWVDLRALGAVSTVTFAFEGTDESYGYLNTPTYFCLDNFNGERVITTVDEQTIGTEVDLSRFFTFESTEASIVYAIADELTETASSAVTLSDDGVLSISSDVTEAFNVVISATQRGKIQFISVPVVLSTGINNIETESTASSTERYTIDGRRITTPQHGVNIIRMTNGETRKVIVK